MHQCTNAPTHLPRPDAATVCTQPATLCLQVPLLYWLGGVTLLFSWYVQNLALVKIYRRPKALDHHVAERSRQFLCLLLGLHVCSSTAFYTRQAYVTGSQWDAASQEPFTLSFLACLVYLVFELASGDMMCEAVRLRDGSGLLHPLTLLRYMPLGALPYLLGCTPHLATSLSQVRFRSCSADRQSGADRLFQEVLDEATAVDSSTHFKEYRCPAPRVPPAAKGALWSGFRGVLFGSNELRSRNFASLRRSSAVKVAADASARWRKGSTERAGGESKGGAAGEASSSASPEAPGAVGVASGSRRSSTCEDLSGSLSESLSRLAPSRSMTTGSVDLL